MLFLIKIKTKLLYLIIFLVILILLKDGFINFLCDSLSSREQNYNKSSKYFVIVKDCKSNFEDKTHIEKFILKKV